MKKKPRPSPSGAHDHILRERLLDSLLTQVPFDGWTETAYAAALKQTGIARAAADQMFPGGLRGAVECFAARTDAAMQAKIDAEPNFAHMRVRDKITFAARARLEALTPHREAVRRLIVWHALPQHAPAGLRRFYKTVDGIWRAAGDTSTDYNFYTKRLLLAGVMKATLLFWLGDETPGNRATWDFLDRRIADVMKLGKSISLLKEFKPAEIVEMVRGKIRKAI